ncbi:FAD-dependent oxidoreductase, partial|uniref:FAD-dependent oxidoreductase n=1 Tax=Escherichia coli TaxID=562 RepID=UPI0014442B3E
SVERGLLYRNAPHLVRNQSFVIPLYSLFDKIKYNLGLKFYDWISGRLSLGASVAISKKETEAKLPNIKTAQLTGGVLYHDGQFDDARLAINLVQTIFEKGGTAINYIKVTGLLKEKGKISGVLARDVENGIAYPIKAKAVVNATGVFADDVLQMDDPAAKKTIRVSQG